MKLLSATIICLLAVGNLARAAELAQPDILLIMPDQMRGDCLSARGHPVVRTPQLDKLAKEGTLFRRAYTTCPSCVPARHSLLTGLFPATSGVVGFKSRPIPYPTLPKMLLEAGYSTALVGRNMHQVPTNNSYGYQTQILASTYVSGDAYDTFLKQAAPESGGIRKLFEGLGLTANGWEAKPWALPENLHPTAWIVDKAREVVKTADIRKPLFLTASFYAPHSPLFPPKKYFDSYSKQKLPQAACGDWVNWEALSPKGDKQGHRVRLEGDALRATQAGYFGLIEHLDNEISALIADFKARSARAHRPWVIVFTTDHGEMLGDHGFFRKCEPYEGSAHIPFLISGSSELGFKSESVSDQPVCLEDVMPTLLTLASVKTPQLMDGVNLASVLRGEKKLVRPWLHLEHADCYSKEQAFHALTDGKTKYIWRPLDGSEQLFDLAKDSREEHDLCKDGSHRRELEKWRERLVARLVGRPEGFSDGTRLIAGRPYPPLQPKAQD